MPNIVKDSFPLLIEEFTGKAVKETDGSAGRGSCNDSPFEYCGLACAKSQTAVSL